MLAGIAAKSTLSTATVYRTSPPSTAATRMRGLSTATASSALSFATGKCGVTEGHA
jgi:hypothetical protein